MENTKNKNVFLISCVSCIVLLLVMCYFGINFSVKGTAAADINGCPASYDANADGNVAVESVNGVQYCVHDDVALKEGGVAVYESVTFEFSADEKKSYDTIKAAGCSSNYACTEKWLTSYKNSVEAKINNKFSQSGWKIQTFMDTGNLRCYIDFTNDTNTYNCSFECNLNNNSCLAKVGAATSEKACYLHKESNKYDSSVKLDVYYWLSEDEASGYTLDSSVDNETDCINKNDYGCYSCDDEKYYWGLARDINPNFCEKQSNISTEAACEGQNNTTKTVKITAVARENEIWADGDGFITEVGGDKHYAADQYASQEASCTISVGKTTCNVTIDMKATKEGYNFNGWSEQKGCTSGKKLTEFQISEDTTVYACYTKKEPSGGGGGGDGNGGDTSPSNLCSGTDSNGRQFATYSGIKTTWTKAECNAMDKDGYCHVWDDNNNCCGVTEGDWCLNKDQPSDDSNVDKNPGTGEIAIFLVWIIGMATIAYSIWYFRKLKQN